MRQKEQLMPIYDEWTICKRQHEQSGAQEDFPPFPEEYVPKAAQLNKRPSFEIYGK